jgi:hypothetical protein
MKSRDVCCGFFYFIKVLLLFLIKIFKMKYAFLFLLLTFSMHCFSKNSLFKQTQVNDGLQKAFEKSKLEGIKTYFAII